MMHIDPNLVDTLATLGKGDPETIRLVETLTSLSERARSEGLLALETEIPALKPAYLQLGIQLIVDGTEEDLIREILTVARHAGGLTDQDRAIRLVIESGVMGIFAGVNPMALRTQLMAFLGEEAAAAAATE